MVNDPIADILIRIKNSYLARAKGVVAPYSKQVFNLCQILSKEGFIGQIKQEDHNIKIELRYIENAPVLTDVKRISKPGLRVYKGVKSLPRVVNGLGIAIISTPKGMMTGKQAKKEGVGGEVMAFIW